MVETPVPVGLEDLGSGPVVCISIIFLLSVVDTILFND